jgi:polyisoprenyl-phosphate glycosyltransferase
LIRPHPALLSVVAPVLDEEETIEHFYGRVRAALEEDPSLDFELVLVDDGSRDRTPDLLEGLASADPRVRVVRLSRRFGYQAAVSAGLDHARGDAIVTIDADLQDPPEVIPELVTAWRDGSDVVYAVRERREGETRLKLLTARWFARAFDRLTEFDVPANAGDFRLLDRRAVDALRSMPERNRFLRGMTVWIGYTQSSVPYRRDPRYAGATRYRWRTLARMSVDAVSSFSHVPLQLATLLGFLVSLLAFLGIPYVIVNKLLGFYVEGVSTLLFALLLLGGIQLITLGIIGEYISRIYDEVKHRPLYLVEERRNVGDPQPAESIGEEPLSKVGGPER